MTLLDPPPSRVHGVTVEANIVVQVEDKITVGLASRDGCSYESPPLPHADALALVRVLTGRARIEAEDGRWTCPIAGGQRTVTLRHAADVIGS
jgi:hypothetical protein